MSTREEKVAKAKERAANKPPAGLNEAEARKPKSNSIPRITKWKKIASENPVWFVTVEGSSVEMKITDPRDITDYKRFETQCFKQLNLRFMPVTPKDWAEATSDVLHLMTVEQADEDTTLRGRFVELLQTYLTNRQCAQKREELLLGRPWEDEDEGRYYFELSRLMKFLKKEKEDVGTAQTCVMWIDELGGGTLETSIKKKSIRLRWVPSDALQKTPDVSPPELSQSEI